MIEEAKFFHSLPSASWRLRKSNGITQSESINLIILGVDGLNTGPRVRKEVKGSNSTRQVGSKWGNFSFPCLLLYSGPQCAQRYPLTLEKAIYFTKSTDPDKMFNLGTLWPVK